MKKFKKVPKSEGDVLPGKGLTDEEFASFCKTPEYLKRGVTGCITTPDGQELYVDGAGNTRDNPPWTRADFKERYGYDPKPVWERIRKHKIVFLGGSK